MSLLSFVVALCVSGPFVDRDALRPRSVFESNHFIYRFCVCMPNCAFWFCVFFPPLTVSVAFSICSLVMKPGQKNPESHLRIC